MTCAGYRICYVDEGQGDPIVFLHNGGGFWQVWNRQLAFFAAHYRVIALDFPGHGKSDACDTPRVLSLNAAVLADFIQQLDLKKVNIIGNCIGAVLAIHYRQQYPSRVNHLVLMNICPGDRLYRSAFISGLLLFIGQRPVLKWLFCFLFSPSWMQRRKADIILNQVFSSQVPKTDPVYCQYKAQLQILRPVMGRFNFLFSVRTYSVRFFLKPDPFWAQSLIIWGEHNRVTPLETDGRYHENQLNAQHFRIIPSGSHLCFYEQAELVNGLIAAHIKAI